MHWGEVMFWAPRTLAITAILISLAGSAWLAYSKGKQSGMMEVQALWDKQLLAVQQAQAEELMKARQRESALQELSARLRTEKAHEARRLAAEYAAAVDSLRNRPERPSDAGVPDAAATGAEPAPSCTGRELYREDGEFLAREAARADQLRLALGQCQAQYESLRSN